MYYTVKCECGNEQQVYYCVSTIVRCINCKKVLAEPTGGRSKINGEIVTRQKG